MQSCMISQKPNMAFFDNPYYDFGNAEFASVNVPVWLAKPFVKNALRSDGESEEVIQLIRKIKKVRMMTVENAKPELVKDFASYLSKSNYQDWVTLKHQGQNVNIQALQNGDEIQNLMLIVQGDQDVIFLEVKGKFTPEDISNVINSEQRAEKQISSTTSN